MDRPFFCCRCDDDQYLSQNEAQAPPNIRQFQYQSQQSNGPQSTRKDLVNHPNSRSVELKTATRKDWVSNQRTYGLQSSRVETYQSHIVYKIESLTNQNKLNKISLSRKRSAYLFTFDSLQNRVTKLKSQYIQQENRMADITVKVNRLLEQEQKDQKDPKISRTTLAPPSRIIIQ